MRHAFAKHGNFYKVSGDTAYGWAFVSTINGVPYFDTGDGTFSDHIPEESIDVVASNFMEKSRAGLDMHEGDRVADVVFAYPMTDAIAKGVEVTSAKTGLLIGWKPYDKDILSKVASGERIGFSIGGIVTSWDIVDAQGNVVESVETAKSAFRTVDVVKSVGYDGTGGMKRRVFRSWKLKEVSLVDRPMQEPALVGVVKGKGAKTIQVAVTTPTEPVHKIRTLAVIVEKRALLTSLVEGHQHVVDCDDMDTDGDMRTSYEMKPGDNWGHDHAVVMNPDGTMTVAANDGHSHTVEMPTLADGAPPGVTSVAPTVEVKAARADSLTGAISPSSVPDMADANANHEQTITALTKRAERAEKLAEMPDAHRAYMKSLPTGEQESFLAKSTGDRDAVIKGAVAYTANDGTVYFHSDDQRLIKSAKQADETAKDLITEKALRLDAQFSKLASDEMGSYSGEAAVHTAIVKAIELGIKDEALRKQAHDVLKAGNAAFAKATRPNGSNGAIDKRPGGDELTKAETELKTAVETYQKSKSIKDYAVAFAEATGDDEASRNAYEKVATLRKRAADAE